ncbi:Mrp/NBP35 family ATP-binding protein [Sutcliffiella cohnii]|uniref:Mrp/NBP35 family ATP-binding protein n=1 Tax=Sutcliffiella cohnii TaxID=33932 RepID=UPI002E23D06B|nr:Mrp/NBP35 family ATP-binding protein [Sutcliffiella cohnii]
MLSGNVISVISGKGGVGKSTVSANLAVSLSKMGKEVALIDFDIYGSSIPSMMNISHGPKSMNNRIIPVESHGVKVMSMGFIVKNNDPVVWRGPMLGKVINQFINDVIWGDLDYVIIDMPPGTGDVAMDVNRLIPNSRQILVTTPHPTSSHVAERAGKMAHNNNHKFVGIVENMSYFQPPDHDQKYYIFGKGGSEQLASKLGTELIARLPIIAPNETDFEPSIYKKGNLLHDKYMELADRLDSSIA